MVKELLIDWNEYPCGANGQMYSYAKKRMLKGTVDRHGYVQVLLKCVDSKYRTFQWHRVIYTYFNGAIPEGYQVNHINEDKTDNRLCNLNLMTPKENVNWGTGIERRATKMKNNPLLSKQVVAVDKDEKVVFEFASTAEAGRNGFNKGHVASCCRKIPKYKTHKGYQWFWKEDWEKINQKC